jgi:hypothetical protein
MRKTFVGGGGEGQNVTLSVPGNLFRTVNLIMKFVEFFFGKSHLRQIRKWWVDSTCSDSISLRFGVCQIWFSHITHDLLWRCKGILSLLTLMDGVKINYFKIFLYNILEYNLCQRSLFFAASTNKISIFLKYVYLTIFWHSCFEA